MGIFAGSGVGKSTLLSMLARNTNADVIVIGLIGERGREVKEFIEDDLGAEGLARTVVVAATSDEAPLVRRQAAYVAMSDGRIFPRPGPECAAADGFGDALCHGPARDRPVGGRAAGRARATRPPSSPNCRGCWSAPDPGTRGQRAASPACLPCWWKATTITSRLSDAVRGILDGHIVLDRAIAERGRYPAINILRSLSRAMPGCNSAGEQDIVSRRAGRAAVYEDMAELIRLGAYKSGHQSRGGPCNRA